ncbi:MAG: 7,8-didemethyl-8-hydroxy-5-deazariboflavin synthase subunit CofH [Promethearchaeia archaeon]
MGSFDFFKHEIKADINNILSRVLDGHQLKKEEAVELLKVTGKEFIGLQRVANRICVEKTKNMVSFVINRNINFTNICQQGCLFCSFSVPPNHEEAFLLSLEEIKNKVKEAKSKGCTEVCIQGGINAEVDFQFYIDILKTVKEVDSEIHIHAFSPQEIFHMAEITGLSIKNTLKELKKNGLGSMPGTAAEILVDEIRRIMCPNKINVEHWKEIITIAHQLDIPTTSTMMYGHIESLEDRIEHLSVLREVQKETKGITEFVPLPFVKKNPKLARIKKYPLKPCYGMADLKLFAVARIFLKDYIDNIQCSWVKLGPKFAQVSLNYGVNDFSGTLMEENISKSAGADYGEFILPEEIIKIIKAAGKKPIQRDTVYNTIQHY